jgi:hypothetical protein
MLKEAMVKTKAQALPVKHVFKYVVGRVGWGLEGFWYGGTAMR